MTNKELQEILKQFPDEMQVKLFKGYKRKEDGKRLEAIIHDFDEENLLDTREIFDEDGEYIETAEDGHLLINPPIQ